MECEDNRWQPATLWDFLEDKTCGEYQWCKERRDFGNCYVCYYDKKEIGLIPVEYDEADVEWSNWWKAAYQRHDGLTLKSLMNEIVERHQKRLDGLD